jgi:superfamily II DNA or RNA helicase
MKAISHPENLSEELDKLRAENGRLIGLLQRNGVDWKKPAAVAPAPQPAVESSHLSPKEKVALFRGLFRGRDDVYGKRWDSASGKSGYAPACDNEWKPGICEKPRIKCAECPHRQFVPVSDRVIYDHLAGKITVGIYPLLQDDNCHFLAVDFDEADWREDAQAFMGSCRDLNVPASLEISRSGKGAHAWIFFASAVPARDARRLGTAIISYACARTHQLRLESYDRLFPNQDTMPKGGFGNLIALPLQRRPRDQGFSTFVDEWLQPHADQWAYLASVRVLPPEALDDLITSATGGGHPLDVSFIAQEDESEPWRRPPRLPKNLPGPLPTALTVTLANQLYFEKAQLPQVLANRLIRLAAFQNPEFYRGQAMRISVWDEPRVIGCAENYSKHIGLPRGCLDGVRDLLLGNKIALQLRDERFDGEPLKVRFAGTLRTDQRRAVKEMLREDSGVLCAPTAFGKTVTAAALIAERGVNTLVLVHRAELLKQWKERLYSFLQVDKEVVGTLGAGKARRTGRIDIALMQSLSRKHEVSECVEQYGHVIVDECHHLSATSFEAILKRVKAKYVLGLTATPIRRDGRQPIIFMQCGPVRHTAAAPEGRPATLEVLPRFLRSQITVPADAGIQDVFRRLAEDPSRTAAIASEIVAAFKAGRKVLVLTERTDHLHIIEQALGSRIGNLYTLHGRMARKDREAVFARLDSLDGDTPRVLLATGRLIGEGFDHPPLDTLVLAMPISWRGTLQQYAGRLHRAHDSKTAVRIIDFVDGDHPALSRMWDKRQRGYRAMDYQIMVANQLELQ